MNHLFNRARLFVNQTLYHLRKATATEDVQVSNLDTIQLEQRMLLSASPLGELAGDAVMNQQQDVDANTQNAAQQVVFFDSQGEDLETLPNVLDDAGPDVEIFMLDAQRDGIEQITETLQNYSNLDAVHLLSTGQSDSILLGNVSLNNSNLLNYAAEISEWGNALGSNGDLLIYGSDLASDESGRTLIDSLSSLTGADIAASDDSTGHETLGGDWDLEYSLGAIETEVVIPHEIQSSWVGLLDSAAGSNDQLDSDNITNQLQEKTIREFVEDAQDGETLFLKLTTASEDKTIVISCDNCILDFGGSTITRSASNDAVIIITGNNNTIRNLIIDGNDVAGSSQNIGIRIYGSGNTLEDVSVSDIPYGPTAHGVMVNHSASDTVLRRVHVTDPGNACFRLRKGAILEDCTGTFTERTANFIYGKEDGTLPRYISCSVIDGINVSEVIVKDSTFSSTGKWAKIHCKTGSGSQLKLLKLENVTIDNRGAVFANNAGANVQHFTNLQKISLVEFNNVNFHHDTGKEVFDSFINCENFVANNHHSDGYIVLFSKSGGGVKNIEINDSSYGVSQPIRRMIDIGPGSGDWNTDVQSVTLNNVTASNIQDEYAFYAKTGSFDGNHSVWNLTNVNLNFANDFAAVAESIDSVTINNINVDSFVDDVLIAQSGGTVDGDVEAPVVEDDTTILEEIAVFEDATKSDSTTNDDPAPPLPATSPDNVEDPSLDSNIGDTNPSTDVNPSINSADNNVLVAQSVETKDEVGEALAIDDATAPLEETVAIEDPTQADSETTVDSTPSLPTSPVSVVNPPHYSNIGSSYQPTNLRPSIANLINRYSDSPFFANFVQVVESPVLTEPVSDSTEQQNTDPATNDVADNNTDDLIDDEATTQPVAESTAPEQTIETSTPPVVNDDSENEVTASLSTGDATAEVNDSDNVEAAPVLAAGESDISDEQQTEPVNDIDENSTDNLIDDEATTQPVAESTAPEQTIETSTPPVINDDSENEVTVSVSTEDATTQQNDVDDDTTATLPSDQSDPSATNNTSITESEIVVVNLPLVDISDNVDTSPVLSDVANDTSDEQNIEPANDVDENSTDSPIDDVATTQPVAESTAAEPTLETASSVNSDVVESETTDPSTENADAELTVESSTEVESTEAIENAPAPNQSDQQSSLTTQVTVVGPNAYSSLATDPFEIDSSSEDEDDESDSESPFSHLPSHIQNYWFSRLVGMFFSGL